MVAFPNPGAYFTDPRLLPRWRLLATSLSLIDNGQIARTSAVAAFFTEMAIRGVAVDSNWSAGVKKTLLTVNGPAVLAAVVCPTSAAADTDIIEIVVDGTTYTSPALTGAAAERIFLGQLATGTTFGTTSTTNYLWGPAYTAQDSTTGLRATGNASIFASMAGLEMIGTPLIRATQSLVVSITHSANLTTTTNQERQAAVMYRPL